MAVTLLAVHLGIVPVLPREVLIEVGELQVGDSIRRVKLHCLLEGGESHGHVSDSLIGAAEVAEGHGGGVVSHQSLRVGLNSLTRVTNVVR
eukprot:scaffold1193_cov159-Ochromonas_danica.AAC.22